MTWRALGTVLPGRLTEARLQLHYATQLVSAPGTSLLPVEPDNSHMNLAWDPALGVLAGRHVGDESLRAALVFESLELAVLEGALERASRPLAGSTLEQGLAWLGEHIADGPGALALPVYHMPAHPIRDGAPFSEAGEESRAELAAWFSDATTWVHEAVANEPDASLVRCWPHHFDVASLITLDRDEDSEDARSVGVGFSPGDTAYDQPYFYVTPWPYPDAEALPALSGGAHWRTEGWTGAVLTAEQLISARSDQQPRLVQDALGSAIAACRALLDR